MVKNKFSSNINNFHPSMQIVLSHTTVYFYVYSYFFPQQGPPNIMPFCGVQFLLGSLNMEFLLVLSINLHRKMEFVFRNVDVCSVATLGFSIMLTSSRITVTRSVYDIVLDLSVQTSCCRSAEHNSKPTPPCAHIVNTSLNIEHMFRHLFDGLCQSCFGLVEKFNI